MPTLDYDNIVSEPNIKRNAIEVVFTTVDTDVEVYHEMGHEVNDWEIIDAVCDDGDPFDGFLYEGTAHSDLKQAINLKCSISDVTLKIRFK